VRLHGSSPPVFSIRTPFFQKNEDGSGKRTSFALSLHSQARATLKRREENVSFERLVVPPFQYKEPSVLRFSSFAQTSTRFTSR
jgi:hypothetical protein